MDAIRIVEAGQLKKDRQGFDPGDQVRVHVKVIEGEKERTQIFDGTVIRKRGEGAEDDTRHRLRLPREGRHGQSRRHGRLHESGAHGQHAHARFGPHRREIRRDRRPQIPDAGAPSLTIPSTIAPESLQKSSSGYPRNSECRSGRPRPW